MLYVCIPYTTVVHRCCCGCGREVVTPLGPTDWRVTFDGETVSLEPSIGNWSFPCRSHYWIVRNRVRWARTWTSAEIDAGRSSNALAKARGFDAVGSRGTDGRPATPGSARDGLLEGILRLLRR
jgi:hypothetical protein